MADGGGGAQVQLEVSYGDGVDGITVVRVGGDDQIAVLDRGGVEALSDTLMELVESGRLILVVDLSAVRKVDETCGDMLWLVRHRARLLGGALTVAGPGREVRQAVAGLSAYYAKQSLEQRRAALVEQSKRLVAPGEHGYEHVSESTTVVRFSGELGPSTELAMRRLLADLVHHGRVFLVLDLSAVDFMDSTALAAMSGGRKLVQRHDGLLAVVAPHERIRKAFQITGLIQVFRLFDTVEAAVEYLGRAESAAYG
ncbi:anti-sigma factor antagonist [Streptomyces boninensis]|uniref:anti-sigma factor antagonist n=1 Tax=Streptomyces boninensis TaxID=2039455 RepID=UPI003B21982C